MRPSIRLIGLVTLFGALTVALPADDTRWRSLSQDAERAKVRGDFAAAEASALQALAEAKRLFGGEDSRVGFSLAYLGTVYLSLGKYPQAERALRQAVALAESAADSETLAVALDALAALYAELGGREREVEALRKRAVDLARTALGPADPFVGMLLARLAQSLIGRGLFDDAETMLEQALRPLDERALPLQIAEIWVSRGAVAFHLGNYPEALKRVDRAIGLYEAALGPRHPMLIVPLLTAGQIRLTTGQLAAAKQNIERARSIAVSALPDGHPLLVDVLMLQAEVLRKSGKKREAREFERKAKAIAALQRADRNALNYRIHVSDLAASQ